MLTRDKEEYIYHTKNKIQLYLLYSALISSAFTFINYYYSFKKKDYPDFLVYLNTFIYLVFVIITLYHADSIKKHSKKLEIDVKSIKSVKLFSKFMLLTLLANTSYIFYRGFITNNVDFKNKINSLLSIILFGTLWFNYSFFY